MSHKRGPKAMRGHHVGTLRQRLRIGACVVAVACSVQAEDAPPAIAPAPAHTDGHSATFRDLSLEDLMNIEVTSVSRHPEKLSDAPSAIQVITGDDIANSGALTLPEALRLAPNLNVAQVNASQWAISARGFDGVLANKLLVMIDGRTVYSPLYGGVFWDVQNVMLADVDRIEVVSGPGGTLWGANAVNGVINVVSKSAEDTQGVFASAEYGSGMRDSAEIRYGGKLADDLYYRIYAERFDDNGALNTNGSNVNDYWFMSQGGFRLDYIPSGNDLTLQGDAYAGRPDPGGGTPVSADGGNVLGRWTSTFSKTADMRFQAYYDQTLRNFDNGFSERLVTWDADFQNRFGLCSWQEVTWGAGYRLMNDKETDLALFGFTPSHMVLQLPSAFLQDEISIVPDRLRLTLGSKIEHNSYTGIEYEPSGRLAWTPMAGETIWAAISKAVRTPDRTDTDFSVGLTPTLALLQGSSDFSTENLVAYELGWRSQFEDRFSLSVSTFYNRYNDILSTEPGPPPFGIPITFANGVAGDTYGVEFATTFRLAEWWYLRGGYTVLKKHLYVKSGNIDSGNASADSDDPNQQAQIQSAITLPHHIAFGSVLRYVESLPNPHVPSYFGLDLRLAYQPTEHWEFSLVGQDLLNYSHPEFVPGSPAPTDIKRSFYGAVTLRW